MKTRVVRWQSLRLELTLGGLGGREGAGLHGKKRDCPEEFRFVIEKLSDLVYALLYATTYLAGVHGVAHWVAKGVCDQELPLPPHLREEDQLGEGWVSRDQMEELLAQAYANVWGGVAFSGVLRKLVRELLEGEAGVGGSRECVSEGRAKEGGLSVGGVGVSRILIPEWGGGSGGAEAKYVSVEVKELAGGEVGGWWDPQGQEILIPKTSRCGGWEVTRLCLFHEIAHAQMASWGEWPTDFLSCLRMLAWGGEKLLKAPENLGLLQGIVGNKEIRMGGGRKS